MQSDTIDELPRPDPLADLDVVPAPGDWAELAACGPLVDVDLWTPNARPDPDELSVAVRVCRRCPVRAECAAYAAQWPVYGLWSGTWHTEPELLRRRRTIAA